MLTELHIKNYRLFEDFKMDGLAQVNLIAGKNNTGKTALLETLRILESRGDNSVVNNIVKKRGQFIPSNDSSYKSLFNFFVFEKHDFLKEWTATINGLKIASFNKFASLETTGKMDSLTFDLKYKIEETDSGRSTTLSATITPDYPQDKVVFVPFSDGENLIAELWPHVTLTPRKKDLLQILSIIESNIEDLDVTKDGAVVLLKGDEKPVPLKSLGDGANRILVLGLALVTAKDKLLLIDEFEAGLHHSVQEQLWEIIFEYAKKWNIQVFATTHSKDAIESFFYVSKKGKYEGLGKYFRLQKSRKGPIEAVDFTEEELSVVLEADMEIR